MFREIMENNLAVTKAVEQVFAPFQKKASEEHLPASVENSVSLDSTFIDGMIAGLEDYIAEAVRDVTEAEASAIRKIAGDVVTYLRDCRENCVEPMMLDNVFKYLDKDTACKMVNDPNFDVVNFINHPDQYKTDSEIIQEQVDRVAENIKAALEPVSPIVSVEADGKVNLDINKVINVQQPADQQQDTPKKGVSAQESIREKENASNTAKGKSGKNNKKEQHKDNCSCGEIQWPGCIGAYFDTASLFMIKDKEMKHAIGCRIAKAFDNLDTLQELTQYAGDAPETSFGFKLTSVMGKNNFVLSTDRVINGRYTKLTFTFFEGGATIAAA